MYYKTRYFPKHPEKYDGNPTNIVMRSSWEVKFALWCESNPGILRWSSEEIIVPYINPADREFHRYFVDFKIIVNTQAGEKTYLVEVKPFDQTQPPKFPGRRTQRYLKELVTYAQNQAKWEAAKRYADKRGWEFKIITEYDLGIK